MRLFVKLGTYKKILIVADHSWTMDVLKEKIEEREGIPRGQQRLMYKDIAKIEGHRCPGFYGITDGSTLHCIVGEAEEKATEKVDEEDPRRRQEARAFYRRLPSKPDEIKEVDPYM